MHTHTIVVVGCGQFPVDMLRFEQAWPASQAEANRIADTFHHHEDWMIALSRTSTRKHEPGWTQKRWQSFGCRIQGIVSHNDADRLRQTCKANKIGLVAGLSILPAHACAPA